jgi:hypothetical protein
VRENRWLQLQGRQHACLSRIAELDQRTILPDQCLHSAEADVRLPRSKSGFDPQTGPSESVATLDKGPRLEDHVTLSELGRIDEAF